MNDFTSVLLAAACVVLVLATVTLVGVLFLSNVARALRKVSPENRRMAPAQVWLNLVPVFNLVWCSITVDRVAESLRNEYVSRGLDDAETTYSRSTGIAALVLGVAAAFLLALVDTELGAVPAVLAGTAGFGCWVGYWVGVNRYVAGLKPGAYRPPPTDDEW